MNEIPITDTERKENIFRIHFIYLEDLTQIYLSCTKDESDSGEMKYYVSLSYENTNYVSKDSEIVFTVVEEGAMFPGGQVELMKYLAQNIKYPQEAMETGIQGLVYVTFVVERDGSLTGIKIIRDIGAGCGEEAVRVVKAMPKWIPAKHKGENVRMQFNLPIKFTFAG
jgi:protein TonB